MLCKNSKQRSPPTCPPQAGKAGLTGYAPVKRSCELISERFPLEYPRLDISHVATYQFIRFARNTAWTWSSFWPRFTLSRKIRTPQRITIKKCSLEAQARIQPRYWQPDTLISSRSKTASAMILGRTSRHPHLANLPAKTFLSFRQALTPEARPLS